eukprot:9412479-Pyramimonas_sp.AAC.1
MVLTLAGTRFEGHQDGPGSAAQFHDPFGIVVTEEGNVIVADTSNHCVRAVDMESYMESTVDATPCATPCGEGDDTHGAGRGAGGGSAAGS